MLFLLPKKYKVYLFEVQGIFLHALLHLRERRNCDWLESGEFSGILRTTRRAGERSEAEQSASTNMAFVTVWFLEKPGTELTPVENCLRAVLELVRRRQNSNVLKVHSFPVILILNMP